MPELIPQERIESKIILLRGLKVMLDRDLAVLYKVKARALRQQVKRNIDRFPEDFMFRLTEEEAEFLVSQIVTPSRRTLGGYLPEKNWFQCKLTYPDFFLIHSSSFSLLGINTCFDSVGIIKPSSRSSLTALFTVSRGESDILPISL